MFESTDRFWLEPVPPKSTPQPPSDNTDAPSKASDVYTLRATGRLANAREVFKHRGWQTLPLGERGNRILRWGADHAWLACPTNPKRSVRRWCSRWMTRPFRPADIAALVAYAKTSNKRWSDDESAMVIEITLADHKTIEGGLRFLGASDDPNYEIRDNIKRAKAAARARKCRANHSTGAKRGRPRSEGPKAWEVLGISERTYYRQRESGSKCKSLKSLKKSGRKNASRRIISPRKRYAISLPSTANLTDRTASNENRRP
jgi:hypothetical protein